MTPLDTHKGLLGQVFSARLSRTLFGAIIALRGGPRGEGFGAVYPDCDTANVAFARNAATDWGSRPLRVPLRLFRFGIRPLDQLQRCNAGKPVPYMCVRMRACAITCATVAALQRCALSLLFLYLPEKKEEKQGVSLSLPTTPAGRSVVGSVVGWSKPLKSFDLRGF